MSITVNSGITVGAGVVLTSESVAPTGGTRFDSSYVGPYVNLINNDTTAFDFAPGTSSILTTVRLTAFNKVMISYVMNLYGGGGFSDNFVGVGNLNTALNQYLGYDTNSVGFAAYGTYFVNGTAVTTGLPTWQTAGDVIDLAVDTLHNNIWVRVNGGAWNGDPAADPAQDIGGQNLPAGLTIPALTIYGQNNSSEFTIAATATYGVPDGYTFLAS